MEITWLGHSTFQLKTDRESILVDPFLNDSPVAPVKATDVEANYILQTHGHFDHIADTVAIAQRTGAKVVANFEICEWLKRQGVAEGQLVAMNLGGSVEMPFSWVKMTKAHHSSSLPDGSYGGNPGGFLFKLAGKTYYFAGDTALFLDMKLISMEGVDVAILPIGDLYTMGPEESLEAIRMLSCKQVIPCHYNTWPPIAQDVGAWAEKVRQHTACEPIVLEVGQPWSP